MTASFGRTTPYGLVAALAVAGGATVALWSLGRASTPTVVLFGGVYLAVRQSADAEVGAFNGYKLGRSPTP